MACLRCGKQQQWADDSRFCSLSCRQSFYGEAHAVPSKPQTLDELIFDTPVADYPKALREYGTQVSIEVGEYMGSERANIYAEHVLGSPFGYGHSQGLKAAWNDYSPEYPPIQRTPLQERLRARIAKFIAPTFKSSHADRADAYARARVDLLDSWVIHNAVTAAVQARPHAAISELERQAFEAEERYSETRRRW